MVSLDTFKALAAALPDTEEAVHFKLLVFGVRKRNFATFDPRIGQLSLRLPHADPERAAAVGRNLLAPVPGKYGAEGWATVDLSAIEPDDFGRLLSSAHRAVSGTTAPTPRRSRRKSEPA